jgi:uncharacterized membrane protein
LFGNAAAGDKGGKIMTHKGYFLVSGVIFSAVALLHAVRILLRWEAVIGGWEFPMWLSAVGLLIAAYLAYSAFRLGWSRRPPGSS